MCDPDEDWWEHHHDLEPCAPPTLEVDVTDNPVVGVLYGLDGEPLIEVRERPWVPFGFQRSSE